MESEREWQNLTTLTQTNMTFYFIRKVDAVPGRSTELLETAYETAVKFASSPDLVSWSMEEEMEQIDLSLLTEKDIFVFGEFRGQLFDKLVSLIKPVILGPICVIECFLKELSLPPVPGPIYSMCLLDAVITTSGLDSEQKDEIVKLVNYMGGNYQSNLLEIGTHLITDTVKSEKYEKAAVRGMKLVLPEWIYHVWENSMNPSFNPNECVDQFKIPIFHNLNVTVTNLSRERKMKVKNLIQENGGTFHSCYDPKITNILISEINNTSSEKFKAAMKQKKICLTPEWIFESVKKGIALPMNDYLVKKSATVLNSTVKPSAAENLMFDCSVLSEIHADDRDAAILNSTCQSMSSEVSVMDKRLEKLIDFEAVRKAGNSFLDGCNIYFIGFSNEDKDILNKVINRGGAVRLETISDDVTHIIAGDRLSTNEEREIRKKFPNKLLLKYEWLLESIKIKQPAIEDMFTYAAKQIPENLEPPSPSTKRNIDMIRDADSFAVPKERVTRAKRNLDISLAPSTSGISKAEDALLNRYLSKNQEPVLNEKRNELATTSNINKNLVQTMTEYESDVFDVPLFRGLSFYIIGFEEQSHAQFQDDVISKFGTVVTDPSGADEVDYVVVPIDDNIDLEIIPIKYKHIVNYAWLDDSSKIGELVPIEYYHRPIIFPADVPPPLTGLTIVISGYLDSERIFLRYLSDILGATPSDPYRKCDCPILLCPTASGSKYVGAIKWGFPVVTKDWLLQCYKRKRKCPLDKFIVGVSKVSDQFIFEELESIEEDAVDEMEVQLNEEKDLNNSNNEVPQCILSRNAFNNMGVELTEMAKKSEQLLNQIAENREQREKELKEDDVRLKAILEAEPNDDINFEEVDRNWKEEGIPTPARSHIIKITKEYEAQITPNTKKMEKVFDKNKFDFTTPKTPDDLKPSALRFWANSEAKLLEKIPVKPETPPTPFEEVCKVFWAKKRKLFNQAAEACHSQPDTDIPASLPLDENQPAKRVLDFINSNRNKRSSLKRSLSPQSHMDTDSIPLQTISGIDHDVIPFTGGTQHDMEVEWCDPSEFDKARRSTIHGMKHQGVPVFGLSGFESIENFDEIVSNIKSLGGELGSENGMVLSSNCTHIIAVQLRRSTKILSAIAAGKWIVSLEYIKRSVEAGKFLNEEFFEWGNPNSKMEVNTDLERNLAGAAYKWRRRIKEQNEKGPFSAYRAIVLLGAKEDFKEIITAGGGEMLDVKKPFSRCPTALSATHCFMDKRKSIISSSDYKVLAEAGVRFVNVIYLNDVLIAKETPDVKKYLIPSP